MKRRGFFPAYLLSLFIWVMASLPGDDLEKIQKFPNNPLLRFFLSDPLVHFLLFGLLTLLICRGFHTASEGTIPFVRVGLLAIGYGLWIEVYQGILPWRSFGLDDLIWNSVGTLFFLSIIRLIHAEPIGKRVRDSRHCFRINL